MPSPSWTTIAPSAVPFSDFVPPRSMDDGDIRRLIDSYAAAARRAVAAGYGMVEIHAAHGYLLHSFLSPLSNRRTDRGGGSFENRIRLTCDIVGAVRGALPDTMPLWLRVSHTDWTDGGWTTE